MCIRGIQPNLKLNNNLVIKTLRYISLGFTIDTIGGMEKGIKNRETQERKAISILLEYCGLIYLDKRKALY